MKTCPQCSTGFEVTDADRAFYVKMAPSVGGKRYAIPEPTLCPDCRMQRRMAWCNELKFYKRTCDLTGKPIISIYSPDKPGKVFDREAWWSDGWDPLSYGREFDFSRPFFEQFRELALAVPKMSLHQNHNENCDFTTSTSYNKDCYLISRSGKNESCYYGNLIFKNKNAVDNLMLFESELCYECVDCTDSRDLQYSQNSKACSDSKFLYDCRDCKDCFFCYGLRHRQYCIKNKQYSKEEYEKLIATFDFTSHAKIEEIKTKFDAFCVGFPHVFYDGQNNEGVTASNHVLNSKNVSHCFDVTHVEDCKYCTWFTFSKDSYDVYAFGLGSEKLYECMEVGDSASNVIFSQFCWGNVSDLLYSMLSLSSQNLFGCIGLRQKKYCVFNKQYSKEEYEALVPKIIEHMRATGEWGEFFPAAMSHFAYNETIANDYYPLTPAEASDRGLQWKEENPEENQSKRAVIDAADLPDSIKNVTDDILQAVIRCPERGQLYRIIAPELKFYREHGVPLPRRHPEARHHARVSRRNPRRLWARECAKCQRPVQTTYAPERPEVIFCKECYMREMY